MAPAEHDEATVIVDQSVPSCVAEDRVSTILYANQSTAGPPAPPDADATALDGTSAASADGGGPARAGTGPDMPAHASSVRYVVLGLAGKGGMGTVHVAKDVDLLRRVALKELASNAGASADARARFIREVQVTAQLDHPHVVPVYSLEVTPGHLPAYAMKLVEGKTFADLFAETRDLLTSGGADERHVLAIRLEHFLKVCDAIAYAHERGVIHRDLKPANLMVGSHNEVYVMDWGLCRLVSAPGGDAGALTGLPARSGSTDDSATQCGAVVGTPRYMSPEQAQGRHDILDGRSDQYALGLILQELVTLKPAIEGTGMTEVLAHAAEGLRGSVTHVLGYAIPRELVAIVERATAFTPERRYPSVGALADDLRRFLRGDAVEAHPDSPYQALLRYVARHRQAAGVLVLSAAALCLAVIVGLLWRHDRALTEQQFRERRIQALATDVSDEGDVLQTRLLLLQSAIVGLADALAEVGNVGQPVRGTVPWQPATATGRAATAVGTFLPLGSGGWTSEADTMARRVLPAMGRIAPWLDEAARQLSRHVGTAQTRAATRTTSVTQLRAYFDAGFVYVAPSTSAPVADPRSEGWYQRCVTGTGEDVLTADTGIPEVVSFCTSLWDEESRPIGALVVTVDPSALLAGLVEGWDIRSADEALLLDAKRHVLAARHIGARAAAGDVCSVVESPDFLQTLAARDLSTFQAEVAGTPCVLAFDRIHPFEWTLVTSSPADAVFAVR
jgi:serine/threonine protein kinase